MSLAPLRGHADTWKQLADALARDRLAHALLFTGPSGIGKALAATRLAARLVCTGSEDGPCGSCNACLQVAAATHPDLLLIAPAAGKKELGVDLARRLKRFLQLQPATAPRKIAIIDDADRLSIAAENALLKSLEEPPGHALLIAVTASPDALLPTVRSRCQRIAFRPLDLADVQSVLEERLGDPSEAARWAALADGSPGRALRLRELWAEGERERTLGLLAELRGSRYVRIAAMGKALGRTEQEMAARLETLLEWYRNAAVCAVTGEAARGESEMDVETALAGAQAIGGALRTLRRRNPNRSLLAEALALRLARL